MEFTLNCQICGRVGDPEHFVKFCINDGKDYKVLCSYCAYRKADIALVKLVQCQPDSGNSFTSERELS